MTMPLCDIVEIELAKRWWAARSAELTTRFRTSREAARKKDGHFTMWFASATYSAFGLVDLYLIPDVAPPLVATRLILSAIFVMVVGWQYRRGVAADWIDTTCASIVLLAYGSWLAFATSSGYAFNVSYYMAYGVIFMMVANLLFNFRIRLAILLSCGIMVAFLTAMLLSFPMPAEYYVSSLVLYVSSFTLTLLVNWKLNVERYHVFLNALKAKLREDEVVERGKELLRLSNTDPLTGLKNRRAIEEDLAAYWQAWQDERRSFAAVLIDIDYFKNFNDHYGHQEGDSCLALVANALADLAQGWDGTVGRFGGEEFIVLAAVSDDAGIAHFAESIRRTVEDLRLPHERRPDGEGVVTVSIGAASTANSSAKRVERLISEADTALYRAKGSGRNCAWVFDQNDGSLGEENEDIATLLKSAIADDLVSLVYQPIRRVSTGRIEAAEALMRLRGRDGRMIPPNIFIPVAERTGAIVELGRWALETACLELIAADLAPVVSVNVSAIQLKTPGFAIMVAGVLSETGIDPQRLAFEITEGREIEGNADVLRCINELRQLGIQLWLDDFGTGFAGLSCLRTIAFDTVKIDRSFLHGATLGAGHMLLEDMVRLIRNHGQRLVVEGVETERHLALLKSLRVEWAQGYHLGRPTALDGFRSLIAAEASNPIRVVISAG
ncbi:putative bifunctional diguanylate cyclase/phosphodiesterase [Mangrovibrevibacter kandeliae]|uniref:putative bifunctional diguanylate cyclase/phosphodiesterase n=1 Tax=Mangrovibrevibacter kandeliae TaxID=2968473 RepID=UPI0021198442|nr:EAL domain-containing protein [Aurantimonas sp. CSK15Z-1]MCQ8781111.1 EAL domain-containing protein [Aurantimonas sp. CSK15Z-1]